MLSSLVVWRESGVNVLHINYKRNDIGNIKNKKAVTESSVCSVTAFIVLRSTFLSHK